RSQYRGPSCGVPRVSLGPCRKGIVAVCPLVAVVHGGLMAGIEVVINLQVDLLAIGVRIGTGADGEAAGAARSAHPLTYRGIQTVTAVETVCVGHRVKVFANQS